jgi:hypothetical protein
MFDIQWAGAGRFHGDPIRVVPPAVRCAQLVASARAAVAELAGLVADGVFGDVPDVAVGEYVSELSRVVEDASAVRSVALAVVDRAGVAHGQGYVSTASWLRDQTRLDARSCRDQIRTARLLSDSYPATRKAWLAGEITTAHASTVVRGVHQAIKAVEPSLRAEARHESEAALIKISTEYSVDHTIAAVKRIRAAVDPDGLRASALELEGKEFFKLTPVADGYMASGWFTHMNGTKLATILEGRRNTKYHTGQLVDHDQNTTIDGSHTVVRDQAGDVIYPDEQSARRMYEQNAHVLAEIADELLTGGHAGVIGGERPHVEITVTLNDLVDQTGHGDLTLIGAQNPDRTTPIPATTVREHTCDAHIRRVILNQPGSNTPHSTPINDVNQKHHPEPVELAELAKPAEPTEADQRAADLDAAFGLTGLPEPPPPDPEHQHAHHERQRQHRERLIRWLLRAPSEILDYGREERIVPPGLRRVLARRDGGCIYPQCTRPPQHTHAHHVQHWADNGATDLANLASLCHTHHHAIHEHNIQITPTPGKQPNQPGYWTIAPVRIE